MHRRTLAIFLAFAALCLAFPGKAQEHTQQWVRWEYARSQIPEEASSLYADTPSVQGTYAAGALAENTQTSALMYVNFLRALAYLPPVRLEGVYSLRAQHGAVLLAANDRLEHDAPRPQDMPEDFYECAHTGTLSSNIAALNWATPDVLLNAMEYFCRDDGEENLPVMGHRSYLLSPLLGKTGLGLAQSQSGISYAVLYVGDTSADSGDWRQVAWPSEGAFPADLMGPLIPWSITLNGEYYDLEASEIRVFLTEKTAGQAKLDYFTLSTDAYGAGPCLIFRPDLTAMGLENYQQNQVWTVRVEGLKTPAGAAESLEYQVEMVSLLPVEVSSVEVTPQALEMSPGDVCQLQAEIIPQWADDLSVTWTSGDEAVCSVSGEGMVTALAPGECIITAASANGRQDKCRIRVK